MYARKSILEKNGIRIPTIDQPWTKDEFTAALKKIKASGEFQYPLDIATGFTGEWWPYAYSPLLQSFGGDLINRSDYKTRRRRAQRARGRRVGDVVPRPGRPTGYMPLKSGADPAKDFINGKTAILYNGTWTAVDTRKAFGNDVAVPAAAGPRQRPEDRWRLVAVGASAPNCSDPAGALDYMKFAAAGQVRRARSPTATGNIPATDAAAAQVTGYEPGGENEIFRQYSKKFAVLRPVTPGYPFIATEFTKTAQDILNGADPQAGAGPGGQGHRRQPEVQQLLPVSRPING